MSIRNNPMKAVPLMLKRVRSVRNIFLKRERDESFDAKLEGLTWELNNIEDLFVKVKKNEDELLDTLTELDGHLKKLDKKRLDQDMEFIRERIRDCAHKLLPMDTNFDSSWNPPSVKLHSNPSSSQPTNELLLDDNEKRIQENYDKLPNLAKRCLGSLSVFPKDAVIKTKPAIYWWIGLGYCPEMETEDVFVGITEGISEGRRVLSYLFYYRMIIAYGNGKDPVVKKFKINPLIRGQLSMSDDISSCLWLLEQQRVILGGKDHLKPDPNETRFIFNVGASYVNFESKWLANKNNLEILQLGRWQDSPLHHIEVGSEEFLKELKGHKLLRYLSLRGISRIFELPPSIAQLEGLQILDLKACHNLETLPNVASMKSLRHLILSKCYLLDSMPKGIEKLTRLQVLKGFVVSSSGRISDLANLKKLRRLSIHIASEALMNNREFESLKELYLLNCLKISWGVSDKRYSDIQIILPPNLEKLHIEGFRGKEIPEWMKPSMLPLRCQELNITGGDLESMNQDENMNWHMNIVRLKYLKPLKINLKFLREIFPSLVYAELKQVSNHPYTEWSRY